MLQEILQTLLYDPNKPMLFHHGLFMFLFANFIIFYALLGNKKEWQKWFLILFSLYFYYKSSGFYILLLLLTISSDYLFSIWIVKAKKQGAKKAILTLSILCTLSFLLYFKYRDFFLESFGVNLQENGFVKLILPIGISFYTFQSISYLVDVYRDKIKLPGIADYLLYMSFFPHLVAGPIIRAKDFLPQVKRKLTLSKTKMNEGFYLIIKGLIKKAIISDYIGQYVDIVYSAPQGASGLESLLAMLAYAMQIFCDFSGYTDMAIGLALLLGYRLDLNFDSPYKSKSITEFWRRWHISLSTWLRDFIYIPLGGNKKGFFNQLLFLMITMSVGGLWHGASWKFVFWGVAHGLLLVLHKLVMKFLPKFSFESSPIYKGFSWLLTFTCVILLWVPFRTQSFDEALIIYQNMLTNMNWSQAPELWIQNKLLVIFIIGSFTLTLLPVKIKEKAQKWFEKESYIVKIGIFIVIIQIIFQMQGENVRPFIYFQF